MTDTPRCVGHTEQHIEHLERSQVVVLDRRDHVECLHLGIREDVGSRVDGSDGRLCLLERLDDLGLGPLSDPLGDVCVEQVDVGCTSGRG